MILCGLTHYQLKLICNIFDFLFRREIIGNAFEESTEVSNWNLQKKMWKNAPYKFKTEKNLRDIQFARTRLKMMMKTFSETSVILIPKWNLRTALTKSNWNKMNLDFSVWKFQIWYERKKRYIRYRNESYSCIISISDGVFLYMRFIKIFLNFIHTDR